MSWVLLIILVNFSFIHAKLCNLSFMLLYCTFIHVLDLVSYTVAIIIIIIIIIIIYKNLNKT